MTDQKKILIVEDEQSLLDMYTMKLEKEGYNVVGAKDGLEGVEKAKQEKPDLILMDVMLPKIDGFRALEEIKRENELKDTPVIMLTNLGQDEDIKKGKEHGALDYLVKANITPAQIATKVAETLKL